ncbi:response regulator transcription factor [Paenibacillus eucommiae]|uniref:Two-component system competent response regulator ComA n=1 Tax=Paenibacillus eucommiae TaxID=1355755 RepID=A0ABS4J519_9BACL|nr:response regulator transcription factor [Paenibacillus eucommiae]MBP1994196.1 two-component system competent response regulator ComA [Paenibacillus eucommiae]
MNQVIKVLVVDDHPLMAQATKQLLDQIEGIEVVGVANDGQRCIELVDQYGPDMVFLDYQLPDMVGTDVARIVKGKNPNIHIVIFTGVDVSAFVNHLLDFEVSGIISKGTRHTSIKNMIACILENHIVLPRSILQKIKMMPNQSLQEVVLTEDEILIMTMIVKGATLEQVADAIFTSKRSVDNYQRKIYEKYGVKTRGQAVEKFVQSRYYKGD